MSPSAKSSQATEDPEQEYKQDRVARWKEGIAKWEEHFSTISDTFFKYADGPQEIEIRKIKVKRPVEESLTKGQNETMRGLFEKFEELQLTELKKPTEPAEVTRKDLEALSQAIKRIENFKAEVLTVVGKAGNEVAVGSESD